MRRSDTENDVGTVGGQACVRHSLEDYDCEAAARGSGVRIRVYLSVKRLVDVHSVVLALLDEHVSTLPDESRGRVGVDGAAKEHCLFLVVAAAYITDRLVHCQNRRVEVCEGSKAEKNKDSDVSWRRERAPSRPGTLLVSALTHIKKKSFVKCFLVLGWKRPSI